MMMHIRIYNWLYAKLFAFFFRRRFGAFGTNVRMISPVSIEGAKNIYVGSDVLVAAQSCLAATPLTGENSCCLELGDGCTIGRFNHIYATKRVVLGQNVLTANNVYISDNMHNYKNIKLPISKQTIVQMPHVHIGDGSWLGHNACVLGVSIGRNCVVGANSVVTMDIPDFCVAVGAPAVVIKRFDTRSNTWRPTHPDGSFI